LPVYLLVKIVEIIIL